MAGYRSRRGAATILEDEFMAMNYTKSVVVSLETAEIKEAIAFWLTKTLEAGSHHFEPAGVSIGTGADGRIYAGATTNPATEVVDGGNTANKGFERFRKREGK
jgi:hypothetical protein